MNNRCYVDLWIRLSIYLSIYLMLPHFSKLSWETREAWWFMDCDPIERFPVQTLIRHSTMLKDPTSLQGSHWLSGQKLIEMQWLTSGEWSCHLIMPQTLSCAKLQFFLKKYVSKSRLDECKKPDRAKFSTKPSFAQSYLPSAQKLFWKFYA